MAQDDGMDVSPSWQELKDERDAMERRARAFEAGAKKLQDERDALAAHVEALHSHIKNAEELHPATWAVRGMKLMQETPTASLVRLKAQWQADALELAGEALPESDCHCSQWLYDMARDRLDAEKRRQAKEAT